MKKPGLVKYSSSLTEADKEKRKRFLGATVITCIAVAMVFGAMHVVKLGSNRMQDMRSKATYDLANETLHIRAAGEDLVRHQEHEKEKKTQFTYSLEEVNTLLGKQQWIELNTTVLISRGPFVMGTNMKMSDDHNRPEHVVQLDDYFIDKYPVTNAQYAQFVVATSHRAPLDWKNGKIPDNKQLHPVTMVSWFDANDYCTWAKKRLPTEAEWEKAARGDDKRRWPWGDLMDVTKLNTYYSSGSTNDVFKFTSGISPFGVYDMAGNVSEWTASNFDPYQGSSASANVFQPKIAVAETPADRAMKVADLKTLKNVKYKVRRGGSWKSDPFSTSTFHRNFSLPHYASDFFGFRCAQDRLTGEKKTLDSN